MREWESQLIPDGPDLRSEDYGLQLRRKKIKLARSRLARWPWGLWDAVRCKPFGAFSGLQLGSGVTRCERWASGVRSPSLSPLLSGAFFFFFFNWVWPNPNYLIFFLNLINWYIFWFVVNLTWVDLFLFVVVVETWADLLGWFWLSCNFFFFGDLDCWIILIILLLAIFC